MKKRFAWLPLSAMFLVFGSSSPATRAQDASDHKPCPVTIGQRSPISDFSGGNSHWNRNLYVGLWPDGTIVFRPGGAGIVYPDGALGMKTPWYRANGLRGKLKIRGQRLDATAPRVRSDIPDGYPDTGFQPSQLNFPSEGCWQVTGTVAKTSVTFVTQVVKSAGLR